MLVCHCNGISDRTIRKAVRDGAGSVNDVSFACGAAACCGGCADAVQQIIHTEAGHRDDAPGAPNSIASSSIRA